MDAMWTDYSASGPLNVSEGPQPRQLTCHIDIYADTPYDPMNDGGLELQVLSTSLRLHFTQYANAEVTIPCPQLILDRIRSGQ